MTTKRPINYAGIPAIIELLRTHLTSLKLSYVLEHFESLLQQAGAEQWPHVDYLARLIEACLSGSLPKL